MVYYHPLLIPHFVHVGYTSNGCVHGGCNHAAIRKLTNLSSGPDELPPLLFRQTCSLAKPLAVLFTQLMYVSAVPDAWKMSIVTPVFKKG